MCYHFFIKTISSFVVSDVKTMDLTFVCEIIRAVAKHMWLPMYITVGHANLSIPC